MSSIFCKGTAAFETENKLVVTREGGGGGDTGVGRGKYRLLDVRQAQGRLYNMGNRANILEQLSGK